MRYGNFSIQLGPSSLGCLVQDQIPSCNANRLYHGTKNRENLPSINIISFFAQPRVQIWGSEFSYLSPKSVYVKSIYIAQAFVYGDSLQSVLVAIVVPDQPVLEKWATENSISGVYSEIIKSAQVTELLLGEIKKNCRESGCVGFEIPARVHVTGTPFSVDNDLLTPTFKLKRNEAKAHFINEIKAMYNGAKLQGE